jgi:peptidoglycan/xylan/chitin deacetylase (PgdA/CDA1 family)
MLSMLQHYEPVTLDDVVAYTQGKLRFSRPVFAVTFDDGYKDILASVEMFQQLGIRPAAFVLSDQENASASEMQNTREFLTTSDLIFLNKAGWTIGCHSSTHPDFSTLNVTDCEREIENSKKALESRLGFLVSYFAYPKGRYSDLVISSVTRAGYTAAFSMDDELLSVNSSIYTLPRVGVDNTHSGFEFEATILTPAIILRSFVKWLLKKYAEFSGGRIRSSL